MKILTTARRSLRAKPSHNPSLMTCSTPRSLPLVFTLARRSHHSNDRRPPQRPYVGHRSRCCPTTGIASQTLSPYCSAVLWYLQSIARSRTDRQAFSHLRDYWGPRYAACVHAVIRCWRNGRLQGEKELGEAMPDRSFRNSNNRRTKCL